jgi:hypothetical protein
LGEGRKGWEDDDGALDEHGGMKLDETHGSSAQPVEKLGPEKKTRHNLLGNWKVHGRHAHKTLCKKSFWGLFSLLTEKRGSFQLGELELEIFVLKGD